MERELFKKLIEWKTKPGRKPLLLEGARQVGKTWLAREFGRRYYAQTVYINFDRERRLHDVFENSLSPDTIISAVGAVTGQIISADDTLIIFDEIQEEPLALSSLKYFCEDAPEYHIIATGSFMGIALHQGTSFPVGKVNIIKLYPLSYREFLRANGKDRLENLLVDGDPESISAMRKFFIDELRAYYIVGGMPEAVASFSENKDYIIARDIQSSIIDLYRQDFSKHASPAMIPRLNQVWDTIPSQLAKENRKFIFGQIAKGARSKDFEKAIMWLADCGLIHVIHRVSKPGLPLKAYEELTSFKIYLNDIGLLGALAGLAPETILVKDRFFSEFKGVLSEQYVLQQMVADMNIVPYYYSAENSRMEIDFIIQGKNGILPVEVKAEENLQSKSLRTFATKYNVKGLRISMSDYRVQDWMTNYPLYAFMTCMEC